LWWFVDLWNMKIQSTENLICQRRSNYI
jgi:hypothetical protein